MRVTGLTPIKNPRPIIHLDSDKVGLAAGAFCATLVMAVGFFYAQLSVWEVAFRTALTFVIVYVVAYVFVRILVSTIPPEPDQRTGSGGQTGESEESGEEQ